VRIDEVSYFQDDGWVLRGDLYAGEAQTEEPSCVVVFCHGFRATKELIAPLFAAGLHARLSVPILVFDYTGFGASEGPRQRFDPELEVHDIRASVSYVARRYPGVPIALFGNSFGSAIATVAMARDRRVTSLVALCAFTTGARLMREMRSDEQYRIFRETIEGDRLNRVVHGKSGLVDPRWILVHDRASTSHSSTLAKGYDHLNAPLDTVSAERLYEFDVVSEVCRLRGRPSLFIHCEHDRLIGCHHSVELAQAAGGELHVLEGLGHYDVYGGEPMETLFNTTADFLRSSTIRA
jgi:pimeloyl-ACP methyl ester carboxylesterase